MANNAEGADFDSLKDDREGDDFDSLPDDRASKKSVEPAVQSKPKAQFKGGAGSAYIINALDGASLGSMSKVLALQDAIKGTKLSDDEPEDMPFWDRYGRHRDYYDSGMEDAMDKQPAASITGQIVNPQLLAGAGTKLLTGAKLAKSTIVGGNALAGMAHGLMSSKSDLTKGEVGGNLIDAEVGGLTAGLIPHVVEGIGSKVSNFAGKTVPNALKKLAEKNLLPALGAGKAEMIKLAEEGGPDAARKIARILLENDVPEYFAGGEGQHEALSDFAKKVGSDVIGATDDALDNIRPPGAPGQRMGSEAVSKIMQLADEIEKSHPGSGPVVKVLKGLADDIARQTERPVSGYGMPKVPDTTDTFSHLRNLKTNLANNQNWEAVQKLGPEMVKKVAMILGDVAEDTAKDTDGKLAGKFIQGNKMYEAAKAGIDAVKGGASIQSPAIEGQLPHNIPKRGLVAAVKEYTGPTVVKAMYGAGKAMSEAVKKQPSSVSQTVRAIMSSSPQGISSIAPRAHKLLSQALEKDQRDGGNSEFGATFYQLATSDPEFQGFLKDIQEQ